jgi:hypothetical protein
MKRMVLPRPEGGETGKTRKSSLLQSKKEEACFPAEAVDFFAFD